MNRKPTKNAAGEPNGWILPLWHVDQGTQVDQVYLTAVAQGAQKGPHLHMKRCGRFVCVSGDVLIVVRERDGRYSEHRTGESNGHPQVYVAPGCAAALYNEGAKEALVLNLPTPPWREQDQDDYPVHGWTYEHTMVAAR